MRCSRSLEQFEKNLKTKLKFEFKESCVKTSQTHFKFGFDILSFAKTRKRKRVEVSKSNLVLTSGDLNIYLNHFNIKKHTQKPSPKFWAWFQKESSKKSLND